MQPHLETLHCFKRADYSATVPLRHAACLLHRFLRFPGGCYVEGDTLEHSFYWKRSVGLAAERLGHWNLWGYWSTDGELAHA